MSCTVGFRTDQNAGGTVHDARRVPGVMDVVDPLKMWVFHQGYFIKAGH